MTYINTLMVLFIVLQTQAPSGIWGWLVNQIPVVVVMGIIIWKQDLSIQGYKRDLKDQSKGHKAEIKIKDDLITDLANKALTVASLYDVKSDLNSKEHDQIMGISSEIRDMTRDIHKTTKN